MNFSSNLLKEIKSYYQKELVLLYGEKEAAALLNRLILHFLGLTRVEQSLQPGFRLSETEILKLHFAVKELKAEKPVQYITGETEFAGLTIKVTPDVLIPRPETEEMVQKIIEAVPGGKPLKILDIGTGSGCIALALKKNLPLSKVTAVDVSRDALKVAKENGILNNLEIELFHTDILNRAESDKLGSFDVIVSNPPYVTGDDKKMMKNNVVNHEPHLALFVSNDDPLLFYRIIADFAKAHLVLKGSLWFEVNENFAKEVGDLLQQKGFKNIKRYLDFYGKERFVSCSLAEPTPKTHKRLYSI